MATDWKEALMRLNLPSTEPEAEAESAEEETPSATESKQTAPLEIIYERKGRRGKEATIIAGFTIGDDQVSAIASKLKSKLGTGGSARGAEILIQGDRRADIGRMLREMGFKTKG